MRDSDNAPAPNRPDATDDVYQPPRLSPEEIAQLETEEEWEALIEEPPQGDLSIISDEDVPGRPG